MVHDPESVITITQTSVARLNKMALPVAIPAMAAGGALLSGAANVYGAISGSGSGGLSWDDIHKNLAYQRTNREQAFNQQMQQSTRFGEMARNMGVSRYSLIGNQGSGPSAVPLAQGPGRGTSKARYMAELGQDIQRGVNNYIQVKDLENRTKLSDANVRLLDAQEKQITSQTQTGKDGDAIKESNIPPGADYIQYDKQLQERGGSYEVRPVLVPGGQVALYPGEEVQDYISESAPAEALYLKNKIGYLSEMTRGQKAGPKSKYHNYYRNEQRRISYIIGQHVEWNPHISRWVTRDYIWKRPKPR